MENTPTERIPRACPSCHAPIQLGANFCPQCGKKFNEPPLSTSVGRQAFIYLFSFFLAPLGLHYAVKYLKQSDPKAKQIGIVVIVLTVLAGILIIWLWSAFTQWEYQAVNSLTF